MSSFTRLELIPVAEGMTEKLSAEESDSGAVTEAFSNEIVNPGGKWGIFAGNEQGRFDWESWGKVREGNGVLDIFWELAEESKFMDEGICLFMREPCKVLSKICVLFEEYWGFKEEKRTFSVKNWEHFGNSCWVLKTPSGGRLNCGTALSFAFKASTFIDTLSCFLSLSTFSGCFAATWVFRLHLCQVRWSQ